MGKTLPHKFAAVGECWISHQDQAEFDIRVLRTCPTGPLRASEYEFGVMHTYLPYQSFACWQQKLSIVGPAGIV